MKRVQEEIGAALKKAQEDMKRQADRRQREVEKWKKGNKVILSTKDLMEKYRAIQDRESNIEEYGEVEAASLDKDLSGGKC